MSSGWGTEGLGEVTTTSHDKVYNTIDPSDVKLRKPYIACVIGASSQGIGAGIAKSYAIAGATGLVLAARRIEGLKVTAEACREINTSIDIELVTCDITSPTSVEALAETAKERLGRLDVVAVNSGYSGPVITKVTETDPTTFMNATNVNYVGTFLCAKYLIPLLLESKDGAKSFIAVSSFAALIVRGPIANTQYCVTKTAQLKLLEHIHEQYHEEGLSAFAVHPGAVRSEMADETTPESFKPYLTDDLMLCGAFCVWLSKNDETQWLSGRLTSAKWDAGELVARKDEIVEKDLLKLRIRV